MKIPKVPQWAYILTIAILIILLFYKSCDKIESDTTKVTITDKKVLIPEVNGKFDKPTNTTQLPSKAKDSIIYFDKLIYVESAVNKETAQKYQDAKTELDKLNIFLNGIRERDYISNFNDSLVEIQAKSKVKGNLEAIQLSYKLKPREVIVQEKTIERTIVKTDPFGVLAGGGVNQNIDTRKVNYEANAGIRIKDFTILATFNTNKDAGVKALIEF